ncbi:MAG: hypothetical protein ACR5LA_10050 [Wolbachia sp.]
MSLQQMVSSQCLTLFLDSSVTIFVHQSSSVIKVAGTGSFMTAVPRDVIPVLGSSFLIENVVLFAINFAGCQCQALTVYF